MLGVSPLYTMMLLKCDMDFSRSWSLDTDCDNDKWHTIFFLWSLVTCVKLPLDGYKSYKDEYKNH